MTQEIQYISVKAFRELGYLQELNRQFLHPLGLALSIKIEGDGTETLSEIWDCRNDPEGIRFLEFDESDIEKAKFIATLQEEKARVREEILGYVIQPTE